MGYPCLAVFVKDWHGDEWYYTLKAEKGLKGAAFIAAVMEMSQGEPLDNLMFYDARPGAMNSLYNTDRVCECLKGYYPLYMFNQLYRQGEAVSVEKAGDAVWATAATGEESAVMLTHYDDVDEAPAEEVCLKIEGLSAPVRARLYLLDETRDNALVREELLGAESYALCFPMKLFDTCLIRLTVAE